MIIGIYGLPISSLTEYPTIINYSSKLWWVIYLVVGIVLPLVIPITKNIVTNTFKSI